MWFQRSVFLQLHVKTAALRKFPHQLRVQNNSWLPKWTVHWEYVLYHRYGPPKEDCWVHLPKKNVSPIDQRRSWILGCESLLEAWPFFIT